MHAASQVGQVSQRSLVVMTVAAVAALHLFAGNADACAVCYGNPDSPMVKAMGAGIWVLLGCIFTVLSGLASMFLYWMSRSRRLSALEFATENATH